MESLPLDIKRCYFLPEFSMQDIVNLHTANPRILGRHHYIWEELYKRDISDKLPEDVSNIKERYISIAKRLLKMDANEALHYGVKYNYDKVIDKAKHRFVDYLRQKLSRFYESADLYNGEDLEIVELAKKEQDTYGNNLDIDPLIFKVYNI